jgi:hypothetical protein
LRGRHNFQRGSSSYNRNSGITIIIQYFICSFRYHSYNNIPQKYLKSVDDLLEELQGQKVGVFAVCGQPKSEVDLMMSEQNLRFKVSNHCIYPLTHPLTHPTVVACVFSWWY